MIESISIVSRSGRFDCGLHRRNYKFEIDLTRVTEAVFDIEITFAFPISLFRNCDYSWVTADKTRVAGVFSPKALKLENGIFVQPCVNTGIWEVSARNPKMLRWRFNPDDATPIAKYTGLKNERHVISAHNHNLPKTLELLFAVHDAIEFSRSPLPFSAVACFTDHCDFDTVESLGLQRALFAECGIRVTKGFFLNHFSKREDNASFAHHSKELGLWRHDGHELAYHSLSQSIKNGEESLADFRDFSPPFQIPTWIDHGYQPYNLSTYANNGISDTEFEQTMHSKNIRTFWNYIDSGTATKGVLNQLNPDDFTLSRFWKGNAGLGATQRLTALLKNIMFHYYADEAIIGSYKSTAGDAKNVIYKRQLNKLFPMAKHALGLAKPILGALVFWRKHRGKPYRFARYSPLVFRHSIAERQFTVFQTIEMIDFKNGLDPENLSRLIAESGVFIAHTYFAAPMSYHTGRMFSAPGKIDPTVAQHFRQLGEQIKSGAVWNPTLHEFVEFLAKFEKTRLDVDDSGNIFVADSFDVPYRKIN